MKLFKRIIALTVIAVIIELGIFIYLEKFYFSTELKVKVTKIENKIKKEEKEPELIFDEGIDNLSFSSDGKYAAYLKNGILTTVSTKDKSEKTIESKFGEEIVFFKWLHNDSRLIVIKKIKDNTGEYYTPIGYDVKKGEEKELSDFDLKKFKIKAYGTEGIDDVEFSTATHSLYIKVKKGPTTSDLYYANVMNENRKVRQNRPIGKVVVPITNTNAVFEQGGEIRVLNYIDKVHDITTLPVNIPGFTNPCILGTDNNANVYFGDLVNGRIKKIIYRDFSSKTSEWKNFQLDEEVIKDDILIDYSGKVYIINSTDSSAHELTTNKTIKCKGEIVQSYNDGIISLDNRKLVKNKIKD